ncbi:hypothetical protein D9M71_748840 [compost metagenome]
MAFNWRYFSGSGAHSLSFRAFSRAKSAISLASLLSVLIRRNSLAAYAWVVAGLTTQTR